MSRVLNVIIEFKCQNECWKWKTFNPIIDGKPFEYACFQGCIRDFFSEKILIRGYPIIMSEETKQILEKNFDHCGEQTYVYAKDLFNLIDKKQEHYINLLQKAQGNLSVCNKLDNIMSELLKKENKDLNALQKLTIEMQETYDTNETQDDIDYYEETIENLSYIKEKFNILYEMIKIIYDLYGEPEVRFITNIG